MRSPSNLGCRQIDALNLFVGARVLIAPDRITLGLVKHGLVECCGDQAKPGFAVITANGLRALADAIDAKRIRAPGVATREWIRDERKKNAKRHAPALSPPKAARRTEDE